ncbi:hypothetical protein BDM02DRAFT_380989 [Thelephora ganbajun]|uniref:Uncharacterized protein n=1 Tax=Thelephora ganbajun TaxID=370292 RepID=A0ACB6Z9H1_THEGA|nr:hypothetical protein BDM02DRAFT_380989 [Thelephora ganbajun]
MTQAWTPPIPYQIVLNTPLLFWVEEHRPVTNFAHGFPFVVISLGLIHKKRSVLGVIYSPFLDHLYTGIRGHGSCLSRNKQSLQKHPLSTPHLLPSLSQALIAMEWGSGRSQTAPLGESGVVLAPCWGPFLHQFSQGRQNSTLAEADECCVELLDGGYVLARCAHYARVTI